MESILKIVVTGEVDSGKSTIVGKFLYDTGSVYKESVEQVKRMCKGLENNFEFAYLLDSLEEERKNQLTIDTTQAFCKTHRGKGLVFIDVPGHKQLLKNMLCGSSYADIAVLVVDVQKSIEEQTKRHAFILKFLGIKQIILALNKMDLIGFNEIIFKKIRKELRELFKRLQLQPKDFIPISAKEGENLAKRSKKMLWYKGLSLIDVLELLNKKLDKKEGPGFYFPIQDVYCLDGKKIYVGNVISGEIRKGERVKISPVNKEFRVKEIMVFNKKIMRAKAQESIGLVLDGVDNIQRGQVIYKGPPLEITGQFLAKIFCITPISTDKQLIIKCSTQQSPVRIKQINSIVDTTYLDIVKGQKNLKALDAAEVIIAVERLLVLKKFRQLTALGRFVLQDNKEICAIGIIP